MQLTDSEIPGKFLTYIIVQIEENHFNLPILLITCIYYLNLKNYFT